MFFSPRSKIVIIVKINRCDCFFVSKPMKNCGKNVENAKERKKEENDRRKLNFNVEMKCFAVLFCCC